MAIRKFGMKALALLKRQSLEVYGKLEGKKSTPRGYEGL
jgi:hypothetical protein